MKSYKQAKEIALKRNAKINCCREYKKAYHFYNGAEEYRDGDNSVVVIKKSGKTVNYATFIIDYLPEKTPVQIEF